ncbi:hypothetical protein CDIK_0539 [Cucumispora dikerogammari]|nr:hypothetical protein CDIK_0539 [Cucumispora dikerogammari]
MLVYFQFFNTQQAPAEKATKDKTADTKNNDTAPKTLEKPNKEKLEVYKNVNTEPQELLESEQNDKESENIVPVEDSSADLNEVSRETSLETNSKQKKCIPSKINRCDLTDNVSENAETTENSIQVRSEARRTQNKIDRDDSSSDMPQQRGNRAKKNSGKSDILTVRIKSINSNSYLSKHEDQLITRKKEGSTFTLKNDIYGVLISTGNTKTTNANNNYNNRNNNRNVDNRNYDNSGNYNNSNRNNNARSNQGEMFLCMGDNKVRFCSSSEINKNKKSTRVKLYEHWSLRNEGSGFMIASGSKCLIQHYDSYTKSYEIKVDVCPYKNGIDTNFYFVLEPINTSRDRHNMTVDNYTKKDRSYNEDNINREDDDYNSNERRNSRDTNRIDYDDNRNRPYNGDNRNRPYYEENNNRPLGVNNSDRQYNEDNRDMRYNEDNRRRKYHENNRNGPYNDHYVNRPYNDNYGNRNKYRISHADSSSYEDNRKNQYSPNMRKRSSRTRQRKHTYPERGDSVYKSHKNNKIQRTADYSVSTSSSFSSSDYEKNRMMKIQRYYKPHIKRRIHIKHVPIMDRQMYYPQPTTPTIPTICQPVGQIQNTLPSINTSVNKITTIPNPQCTPVLNPSRLNRFLQYPYRQMLKEISEGEIIVDKNNLIKPVKVETKYLKNYSETGTPLPTKENTPFTTLNTGQPPPLVQAPPSNNLFEDTLALVPNSKKIVVDCKGLSLMECQRINQKSVK